MLIAHCTLFFAQGSQGWVEQFWRSDATIQDSLAATVALATERWKILSANVNLYKVRVSALGVPRCSLSAPVYGLPLAALAGSPDQGVEIRLQAGDRGLYRRTLFLRGVPASAITAIGGGSQWNSGYGALAQRWLDLLASGGWLIQAWGRESQTYPITGLAPSWSDTPYSGPRPYPPALGWDGWSSVIATVIGTPILPEPEPGTVQQPTVRVGRVRWSTGRRGYRNGVNGEFDPFLGDVGILQWIGSLPATGTYLGGGYAQLRTRAYVLIRRADLTRVGVRATGPAPTNTSVPRLTSTQIAAILQTPAGLYIPFPPSFEIPVPLPPPPLPPIIPVPPPPPPVSYTIATLQDALRIIHDVVQGGTPPKYTPLATAQVLNRGSTWVILLNGTEFFAEIDGGLSAVATAFQINTDFVKLLKKVVTEVLPQNENLIIFAYSQGGMAMETVLASGINQPVISMAEFGCPIVSLKISDAYPIKYYNVTGDVVPFLSPWSAAITLANSRAIGGVRAVLPSPIVPIPIDLNNPTPFYNHINMYLNKGLLKYDWAGATAGTNPPLKIGPLTLYPVVPTPP